MGVRRVASRCQLVCELSMVLHLEWMHDTSENGAMVQLGPARIGGWGSTASQRTDGEFAPAHAVGKVPLPWGSECRRETGQSGLAMAAIPRVELTGRLGPFAAAQSCRERSYVGAN